jgi:hypothetical protein
VVPDAGRRHGVRRPHVHRLLLHVSPPSSAICYCPVYLAIWRITVYLAIWRISHSLAWCPDLFCSDLVCLAAEFYW